MNVGDQHEKCLSVSNCAIAESSMSDIMAKSHVSLQSAMELRKQSERDAQLLSNRIKLLRQEESKAVRTIELARMKAARISAIRNDSAVRETMVYEAEKGRQQEKISSTERNRYIREIGKVSRESTKEQMQQARRRVAMEARATLRKCVQEKAAEESEEKRKSLMRAELMRQERTQTRLRQEEGRMNRVVAYKEEYAKRIDREDRKKLESDMLLSKLEKEELALIRRLQKAQELQTKICADLKSIPVSPELTVPGSSRKSVSSCKSLPPRVHTPTVTSLTRRDIGGAAMR